MRSAALLAFGFTCLTGCASSVSLESRFDPQEVAWFSVRGTNSIEGTVLLRGFNGTTKTCAALPVLLFPDSAYARERMRHLYESDARGFNPILLGRAANFTNDDPRYMAAAKTTHCDGRGRFGFAELPDGEYFIVGMVVWKERANAPLQQGGYLMQRVHVEAGETKEVLLTR